MSSCLKTGLFLLFNIIDFFMFISNEKLKMSMVKWCCTIWTMVGVLYTILFMLYFNVVLFKMNINICIRKSGSKIYKIEKVI